MKKICIYCQTWGSGGIESFLKNVLQNISLSELQVDIVVETMKKDVFINDLAALGVTFRELSGSQNNLIQNYRRLAKLMNEQMYDVFHLNVFQALPCVYLSLAKRKGIPRRIAHSHNTMLRKSRTRFLKQRIHRIASCLFSKDATDFWACSDGAAKFMFPTALLKRKGYQFIPNGIDLHRFQFDSDERKNIRKQLHLEGKYVIGNVGRLCYQKNQNFLLEVFAKVHAKDPTARLLLIGEGEGLNGLKEKARRLSIVDSVIFWGTTLCVEKLLWIMDIFVFPSIFEGLPITTVEAQAAGLPCILSECVTKEAIVAPCVERIPLECGSDAWANAVLKQKIAIKNRKLEAEKMKGGIFDIKEVAMYIEKIYKDNAYKTMFRQYF